jgi:polyhydroxybutyrate depolymerase
VTALPHRCPGRRPILALAVLSCLACSGAGRAPASVERRSVRVGNATRTYTLYVPARLPPAPRALVLAFHGTGESGREMRRNTALDTLAERAGFLVAYPDAAVGNWAEGCACSRADVAGVDDTGFVRAVVDDVVRRDTADRRRVHAVGFSQGGLFVQRLACQMADLLTAVASIAAPMSSPVAAGCAPAAPVGVLVLQGTLDDAYPYEGQRRGGRSLLGARETADLWRLLDGCAADAQAREWPDRAADGTRVLEERWGGCRGAVEVVLYSIDGGRHAWSPTADVATEVLLADHFRRARPAP